MRLTLFLLIALSLFGRDNPFFPADPNEKQVQTTNRVETLKPYSTQKVILPNSARAIKSIIIRYQNLDGSIAQEQLDLNNQIDWHEPFVISQKQTAEPSKMKRDTSLIKAKFIKFKTSGKSLKVITNDKLLRHFMLNAPHRIVMDFSRDTSFRPKVFKLDQAPYKKIRMGNHDKYYRVVIELDGQYKYKLQDDGRSLNIVCY